MIDGLKPYPTYRDSGSSWVGEVPAHWQLRRLGVLLTSRTERNRPDLPLLSVARERGVFVRSLDGADGNYNFIPADLTNYKIARAGDLVINKMKAWQGSMGIAPCDGIVSPAYFVFDFGIADGAFGQALLRSKPYVAHFARVSDGVRIGQWDLSVSGMRQIPVVLPPPPEQTAIVRFVTYAERCIRQHVRAKQKLIDLLAEQKQAVIQRAVTRGVDDSAPRRDSGLQWQGDIPAHWDVLALKRVLERLIDCEHKTAPAVDSSEFLVVRTTAVRHGQLRFWGTYCTTPDAFEQWTRRGVPVAGDVIFTREAPAGEACVVPSGYQVCLGQRTVLMKVRQDRYDPQFLVHMIYGGPPAHRIRLASQGSTVGHFNMDDIASMAVLAPPLGEQQLIVSALADQTADLDGAMSRAEREISLLREYRTRLIIDVVTGKLDVKEAATRLPEPADDPMALDEDDLLDEELEDDSGTADDLAEESLA